MHVLSFQSVNTSHALTFYLLSETPISLSFQANEILSSFDDRLRKYATKQLTKVRINKFFDRNHKHSMLTSILDYDVLLS